MFYHLRNIHNSLKIQMKHYSSNRFAFVIDHSYPLISKLKQQNMAVPQLMPISGYPSSFSRNLLHPYSKHIVSKYASQYFNKSTSYYGDYPVQFFPSEIYSRIEPTNSNKNNEHTIIIYPEQITITHIEPCHIPHIINLCDDDKWLCSNAFQNDCRIEKLEGINIYFFCDVSTMDRIIILFKWFDYCFNRHMYKNVHYIFATGNLNNDQTSSIMIHNGKHQYVISQNITFKEIDTYVCHLIDTQ